MTLDIEIMSDIFTKFHLKGMPVDAVIHKFTEADMSYPHDHPFSFQSLILFGGYVERRYNGATGRSADYTRCVGDLFTVSAETIHQIISLPAGECWTLILPQPKIRESRIWDFSGAVPRSRQWNEEEWK